MVLIEVFLPLEDGDGRDVPRQRIEEIVAELAKRFGGATAFTRSPAKGLWKERAALAEDRIVIVEVMTDEIDPEWWGRYRRALEIELRQERILIRATECRAL